MNLLIIRAINYENKNKNKKFNNALKIETFKNKNEFKSHNKNKNKNKSEIKLKKSNEMSDNVKKKKLTESSATISTETNLNTDLIETLRIQVDNQILMLHDSHYSSNTVTNLIFFEMLEQQEFEIKKIKKSDDLCLFSITDLEDQVF